MTDLELAIREIRADEDRIREAEEYADNRQAEVFASARIKRLLERTGRKFRVNWGRVVINAVLNRLEINGISTGDDELDEVVREIWDHNDLSLEAPAFMEKALEWGECYALAWPGEEPEDPDDELDVDIMLCSPLTSKLFYDHENGREKLFFARMWTEPQMTALGGAGIPASFEDRIRVNLIYPDRIEKWISKTENGEKQEDFEPYIDSWIETVGDDGELLEIEEWPIPHDFGEVPAFHFRTRKTNPKPEHYDAYGPQDMLNKLTATQMATNDFQGFPQRYALTGRDPKSETTFEGDFEDDFSGGTTTGASPLVDADDRPNAGGEMNSGPGEVWLLKADKVGQFTPADPDVFLKPMAQYIRAMATATSTPLHHFEGQQGAPSGESLRVAEAPLIKKVKDRQKMFGSTWRDIFRFAFKLKGYEDVPLTVSWASAQSQDDLQGWELVKAKLEVGMPLKQVLVEHGYTPEMAEELIKAAKEEAQKRPAA